MQPPLFRTLLVSLSLVLASLVDAAEAELPAPRPFELHRVSSRESPGMVAVPSPQGPTQLYMEKTVLMDETSLKSAKASKGRNTWEVQVTLTAAGAKLLQAITTKNVGEQIGIVCNGNLISAPRINEPIPGGSVIISGSFDQAAAEDLAAKLNAAVKKP